MEPDAFWRQTPRLFGIVIGAKGRGLERERRRDAWLAWHIAALGRVKKGALPSIDQLAGIKAVIKKQKPDEVKALFAAMRQAAV